MGHFAGHGYGAHVVKERVWVNVGFVKDATFKADSIGTCRVPFALSQCSVKGND